MRNRKKIGLSILAIVIGVLLVGVVWQRENITAVWEATRYSETELGQQITETKRDVEQALIQYEVVDVRDLSKAGLQGQSPSLGGQTPYPST